MAVDESARGALRSIRHAPSRYDVGGACAWRSEAEPRPTRTRQASSRARLTQSHASVWVTSDRGVMRHEPFAFDLPHLRGARNARAHLGAPTRRCSALRACAPAVFPKGVLARARRRPAEGLNHRTSGEGGIRTLGTLSDTHDFQSCTFGHSVTSPLGGL